MVSTQRFLHNTFGVAVVILLFSSYPLALIPPGFGGASYYVRVPSLFILAIVSFLVVLISRFSMPALFKISLVVFQIPIVYHLLTNVLNFKDTVAFAGGMLIPLAFCLYTCHHEMKLEVIEKVAFALWGILVLYGFMNYVQGKEVIGITGNRNWMAISLLSLFPWVIDSIERSLKKITDHHGARRGIALLLVCAPGFFLIFHCSSRAAWLALAAFWGSALFHHLVRKRQFLLIILIGLSLAISVFAAKKRLIQAYNNDIRLPTWRSTVRLLCENPIVGVGPGHYTNAHARYRAETEYHRRVVATELTTHPHNEFLNIAANLGLIAAMCWIILLFPLLPGGNNRTRLERFAGFSAFVIYFHSMLDKPLVQPPSNLIGLCCLGICWRPYVVLKPGTPAAFQSKRWVKLLFLVMVGVLGLLVARQTITDIGAGWYRRMAVLHKKRSDYELAFTFYKKMIDLDPSNIRGYYGAGSIALQRLRNPSLALDYLLEAAKLDSDYAHLNRLIGKTYGAMGDHNKARSYFERDCFLFPSDITSFRNYFSCLTQENPKVDRLVKVHRRLMEIYVEKTSAQLSHVDGQRLAKEWKTGVVDGNMDVAIERATQICRYVDYRSVDPLLHRLPSAVSLPVDYRYDGFNCYDFEYWKAVIFRNTLVNEITHSLENSPGQRTSVADIFDHTVNRFVVQPHASHFEMPSVVWQRGHGSPLSYSSLVNWLVRGRGMQALVCQMSSNSKYSFPVIRDNNDKWYLLNWLTNETREIQTNAGVTGVDLRQFVDQTGEIAANEVEYKVFFIPQEFLIKNQILSTLINHYQPENQLEFTSVPTIVFYETINSASNAGLHVQLQNWYLPAPFKRLIRILDSDD